MNWFGPLFALISLSAGAASSQDFDVDPAGAVSASGDIHLPQVEFLRTWPVLGSWTILDGEEAGGFHTVYTQPGVIEAYLETGSFPDGAVIVKELRSAATGSYTTGTAAHASELEGWFVMVKDTQGRFTGNPAWGDGWGWGQFQAGDTLTSIAPDYQESCLGCHVPAQDSDWIYTQAYPVLSETR
ncbi:hypothetical protein FEE96_01960 [Parasedimentitalea maritima]|uniref:Cytochrome P460 domain-containing protein n=1 Tax=Parasedimentitalea maritima TaxID=2578117 RepID=A0ABY2V043_9RHOB|nr:cytochrome P460 family protein [Zongyanglinia marina]TLP69076.1 hypothetical protein FEE96_01960 [Zongyanglinia marina]